MLWWRLPVHYKQSLHFTFAVPLDESRSPSYYLVQMAIKRHASQLRTSIEYHIQQAPRMTMSAQDAFLFMSQQWLQLGQDGECKQIVLGFLLNTSSSIWWLDHFPRVNSYSPLFCDYLYCAAAAAKNMARN
jgi:hypothetical protein